MADRYINQSLSQYTITVGAGGAGATNNRGNSTLKNGKNSSALGKSVLGGGIDQMVVQELQQKVVDLE